MISEHIHETPNFVDWYANEEDLDGAEALILERLKTELATMRMLDIGVGGGRTTIHFAPVVKSYTSIDYDVNMVKACGNRFPNPPRHVSFAVGDARSLEFDDDAFDFILFSANGIDYVGPEDRAKILQEISRVGRIEGFFAFSSHNIYSLNNLFVEKSAARKSSRNPVQWLYLSLWFWLNKNPSWLQQQDWAMVRDYMYFERLKWVIKRFWIRYRHYNPGQNYYIKPEAQMKQLAAFGFKNVEVFTIDGRNITHLDDFSTVTDVWLHYLCQIR